MSTLPTEPQPEPLPVEPYPPVSVKQAMVDAEAHHSDNGDPGLK